jgi:hypothetical protein
MRCVVECQSCDLEWPRTLLLSIYEREAIESRPCPGCGACTLCCRLIEIDDKRMSRSRRRKTIDRRVG